MIDLAKRLIRYRRDYLDALGQIEETLDVWFDSDIEEAVNEFIMDLDEDNDQDVEKIIEFLKGQADGTDVPTR